MAKKNERTTQPPPIPPSDDAENESLRRTRKEVDPFEHGRQRALESGATEPQESDLRALEHYADSIARESHQERYDPKANEHDAIRESEHAKVIKDRPKLEEIARFTAAESRDGEKALGKVPRAGDRPRPRRILVVIATLVAGLTLAPTCSSFFAAGDEVFGVLAGVALGIALGALLTGFILYGHGEHGERSPLSVLGAGGGILIAIAFGGFRIHGTEDLSDVLLGVFLTLIEVGVVVFLEVKASSLRSDLRQWHARFIVEEQATRERDAAKQEHERSLGGLAEAAQKIRSHLRYVESRSPRFSSVEEAIGAAVKAVHDGYFAGIAENRGYLLGAGRRPQ